MKASHHVGISGYGAHEAITRTIVVMPAANCAVSGMDHRLPTSRANAWYRALAIALLLALSLSPVAGADEPGETTQGYLLVQQALGHLAHDTGHEGMDAAMEKVQDALATEDKAGVDVSTLKKAQAALESEQVDTARAELQASISEALSAMPPATGEDTGTRVVVPALDTRGRISGLDWLFLALSLLAVVGGVLLAYRFRPADSVADLRRRMAARP